MILVLLAWLGGVLTILSPCILPVLPFVFARADRPFLSSGLSMLLSMAATFAAIASLATVVGGWVVAANEYGRQLAMVLLAGFGLTLLFPSLGDRLAQPMVALGGRLTRGGGEDSLFASVLLGVATGLLWAPCAGPILGLVLTGAATEGTTWSTGILLLAYATGAACSLGLATLGGKPIFAMMKRSLGATIWLRRALGAAVIAGVAAIAFGLDTGLLTRLSAASTATLEQGLLDRLAPPASVSPGTAADSPEGALPLEADAPRFTGAVEWLNSPPLTREALRGKVVLVDFWTYSCINCLRAIPYVRAWAEKYRDEGLVVIGVHTPEFAFERNLANVRRALADLRITYPVAVDNNYAIWRAFGNRYWPAHYFIDARGRIRHHHFGEGSYEESERVIQTLLAEANGRPAGSGVVQVRADGAEAASDESTVRSPETYLGFQRAENFVSPGGVVADRRHRYATGTPRLNEWGLAGEWTIGAEHATLDAPDGTITFRFHARDLHLVLGPAADGHPVRFLVTVDGMPPGDSHGNDIDAEGNGVIDGQRLYQLLRQPGPVGDRTFQIRFLDPGVQAFAFTFG